MACGRLTVLLDRMGVLAEADGFALERLCDWYAEIFALREMVLTPAALADAGRFQDIGSIINTGQPGRVPHGAAERKALNDLALRVWSPPEPGQERTK